MTKTVMNLEKKENRKTKAKDYFEMKFILQHMKDDNKSNTIQAFKKENSEWPKVFFANKYELFIRKEDTGLYSISMLQNGNFECNVSGVREDHTIMIDNINHKCFIVKNIS